MSQYALQLFAKGDVFEIWSYIACDSEEAADRVLQAIFDACEMLATRPHLGRVRPEVTTRPVRFWTLPQFPNYMIVYRPDVVPLPIIAVLNGKRSLSQILKRRS